MLKTCFLPSFYPNLTNKTCGEIICQTETTFTIICKLCDIKIFEYEEFIKHFRSTHLPEIFKSDVNGTLDERSHKNSHSCDSDGIFISENHSVKEEIKNEKFEEKFDIEQSCHESYVVQGATVRCDEFLDEQNDSEDLSQSVAILRKSPGKSSEITKEKRFGCVQCKRKFTTNFYLRFHIRQQHEPKNFQCDKCSKSFVEKRYLTSHQRSHIGYTCQVCHKVFDKYEALRYHRESHIETRNFLCDYENCGKAFLNKRRLSAHKRSHYAQHLFVCEVCGLRKRDKQALMDHIRKHTGEKPFACPVCDRRFTTNSLMNEHKVCHETERKHVCDICGKSFNRPKALYHHKPLHLGIKKFKCKLCGSAYAQAAGLSAHLRKHKENKICQLN